MGIELVDNFTLSAKKSLDSRQIWSDVATLRANTTTIMPQGFMAYCKAEDKYYSMTCTDESDPSTYVWKEFSGGEGSGSGGNIESISVNGEAVSPDDSKNVDITIPTVTNDLTDELKEAYDSAVEDDHTHANMDTIDKFSVSEDGELLFDGKAIEGSGGGEGGTDYTGSAGITVGGIVAGTELKNISYEKFVDMLINPYQKPVISIGLSPNTSVYENGVTTAGITMTANVTKKSKAITEVKFYVGNTLVDTKTDGVEDGGSFTYSAGSFTSAQSFKVETTDGDNAVNASASFTFVDPTYYGIVDTADVTDTIIKGLTKTLATKKGLTYSGITMTNKRICYAFPASYGTLTSCIDGNGYQVISSYTKKSVTIGDVAYNAYVLTDTGSLSGGKMVFS